MQICIVIAECNMSWTLKSTGGDLVGHNGETFAIVFRGSPSLPFICEDELAQLRIHRKRCLRSKAVQSLMRLGDLINKSANDISLTKVGTVCVVPSQVLNSEELSEHEFLQCTRVLVNTCLRLLSQNLPVLSC